MDEITKAVRKFASHPTRILSDTEVRLLTEASLKIFGQPLADLLKVRAAEFEDGVRWASLGAKCSRVRLDRKLDIKGAAKACGIPQYRIKEIEAGRLSHFRPDLAWAYFEFLTLTLWVKRWARANQRLADKCGLGLPPRPGPPPVKGSRKRPTAAG